MKHGLSMYQIIKIADEYGLNKIYKNTREFVEIIEDLNAKKETLVVSEIINQILEKTKYIELLKAEESQIAENRKENLEEFIGVAMEFEMEYVDNSLTEFLESITLSSDIDNLTKEDEKVTLMTLHSAKGLEFEVVFLVGMEEGIFPGYKSMDQEKEIEEERRLCYVGITRAKQHLYLICAKQRTIFGATQCNKISRFIKEIPKELLQGHEKIESSYKAKIESQKDFEGNWIRIKPEKENNTYQTKNNLKNFKFKTAESFLESIKKNKEQTEVDITKYKIGQKIFHPKFGEGIIEKVEAEGNDLKLDISFKNSGKKRLMAKYAKIEII